MFHCGIWLPIIILLCNSIFSEIWPVHNFGWLYQDRHPRTPWQLWNPFMSKLIFSLLCNMLKQDIFLQSIFFCSFFCAIHWVYNDYCLCSETPYTSNYSCLRVTMLCLKFLMLKKGTLVKTIYWFRIVQQHRQFSK